MNGYSGKYLNEMYNTMIHYQGLERADNWRYNLLTDGEQARLERYIEKLDKKNESTKSWSIVTLPHEQRE